jgi:DNA-binding Lrp family transcriptional regulator
MRKLTPLDIQIICQLIINSRQSDRQIAKKLKISQPTVTRRRTTLEKERLLEYTSIPDLKKLGFEIIAFIFGKWNLEKYPDTHANEMQKFIHQHPNIIFISTGTGQTYDRIGISAHKNYSDYSRTIQDFQEGWGKYFENFSSFIVSLQSDNILLNITFRHLAECMSQTNPLTGEKP